MKRSFVIISLLIVSALFASLWMFVEDIIIEKTHPLPYYETVCEVSEEFAVPKEIIYGVMNVESSFKSDAVSSKGAVGLMQITPDTFDWLCMKAGEKDSNPELLYNPELNIRYGTFFLSLLYSEFGVWDTVYAAYNAGRGRVNEWLKNPDMNNNGKIANIPFPETEKYVKKVSESAETYRKLLLDD